MEGSKGEKDARGQACRDEKRGKKSGSEQDRAECSGLSERNAAESLATLVGICSEGDRWGANDV